MNCMSVLIEHKADPNARDNEVNLSKFIHRATSAIHETFCHFLCVNK